MRTLVEKYFEMPAAVRRPMWRVWHNLIIRFDKNKEAVYMNYDYQSLDEAEKLQLLSEDENNRYCAQLYDFVVSKVDVKDKDILEVGSGRGGGASHITSYRKPKSYDAMAKKSRILFHQIGSNSLIIPPTIFSSFRK